LLVRAKARYIIATNTGAFVLGLLILFGLSRLPLLLSPLASGLIAAGFALVLGGDLLFWVFRGIRLIEIDTYGITLFVGRRREARKIEADAIRAVRLIHRLGRRRIVLSLKEAQTRAPFWKRALRKELMISDDAFSREDFAKIIGQTAKFA
jgi:hypothetical protein